MRARPLPTGLPPVFTVAQGRAVGVPEHRMRGSDLRAPFSGVRAASGLADPVRLLHGLQLVLPESTAFSHATGAYLWRLPVPEPILSAPSGVHVTVPRGEARIRRAGVVPHVGDRRIDLVQGLRVTDLGSTWCDLATQSSLIGLVQCGDAIVNRSGWDLERLTDCLAEHPGRRGRSMLNRAIELIRPGSGSPMESASRLVFHQWALPEPELNQDIVIGSEWLATVDFLWREQKVIVEYYGGVHEASWKRDLHRVALLEDAGYRVIVITGDDLTKRLPALRARLTVLLLG